MSTPISLDLAENEQPVQAAQSSVLQHLPPPQQEDLQAQVLPQVPQVVSCQPKSLQGSLPASQRPLLRPQHLGNGSEQPEPEPGNLEQREQRQYVFGEALIPLPTLWLRSCLPSADVHERGAAPPGHISRTASLVDPPLSAADSASQTASHLSWSDSSSQTAAACSRFPNPVSLSCHRAQQRHKDSSIDSNLADNSGQREHNTRCSRKCAQSSTEKCLRPSRKPKSCIGNSWERTTRKVSGCDFKKISEPIFTRECKSSERESPNLRAEKSSGSYKQRTAGEKQKSSTQEEPDSPKIPCPAQRQTKRRGLRASTSAVSSGRFQERTSSQIHFSLTASHQRDGWEPRHVGAIPCTKATGEISNSAHTLPSSQPRGQRKSQDSRPQVPSTTHTCTTPDRHKTRLFTEGRRTEKRKKTCKRRSTARSQQGKRRQVPREIHAEVHAATHQQKQGCSKSPQSSPHSAILQTETALTTSPTLYQGPAWGAERASISLCSPRKTRRTRDRCMGGQRQLWSNKQDSDGGKEVRSEEVSSTLSTALTMLCKPSQSAQTFSGPDSDLTTRQPDGASVSSDQHCSPGPLKIKAEIVDEEYPHGASEDTPDSAKPEPEENRLRADQDKQLTAGEGPKHETEEADQPADTPRQWSVLYEASLSQSSISCSSVGTLSDKDTKEELKNYLLEDVKLHTDKVTKEENEEDIERCLYRNVKEDGDPDIQNNEGKDEKENARRERIQHTDTSSCTWSGLGSERHSWGGDQKVFKTEPVGEVKKEEDGYDSLTEVTPTFLENALQTAQPLHLPSGDGLRISRNQQRRKQKTPRQIRKLCVLQTEPVAKNESIQTDGDGDAIIKEGVLLTDDPTVLKKKCHWQYQPGCNSCVSRVCLEIPAGQKSLPFPQTDCKEAENKGLTWDSVKEAKAWPGSVSGSDHLLNHKSLQIFGNHTHGWDTSSSVSLAGNVGSNQGVSVVSTASIDSKTRVDFRSQMLQLKMVDVLPVQTTSTKGAMTEHGPQSVVQTVGQSSAVMSVPATPLSLVRLPYIPVPVHCPPIPAVFPSLPKHQMHPTLPLPFATAVGLTTNPKTAQHPSYIPIVPKMPSMPSAVPTKLSVSGISQTMSNVAKGEALSGPHQSVHNAYTAIPSAVSVLNVQQQQAVETSGVMMPAAPQLGVVRSQMIPACAGSIPVLIFLPSLSQNAPATQVRTDLVTRAEGLTMAAKAKTSPEQQGQEKTKSDPVSGKEISRVYVDGTNSDDKKQDNHQHKMSASTDRDSSTAGRRTESNRSRSREVDFSTESTSKTTENSESLAVRAPSSSCGNTPRTSAETSSLEKGAEAASTVTLDPGHTITGIAEDASTSSFPFHYDACKRAEEIVFSMPPRLPPQVDVKHPSKKITAVTNKKLPDKKENSQTSTKKSAAETLKSASTSKSGRKRIASTRYHFHSEIEFSDGSSEKDDITPITSDDEWTPEKDSDGQSTQSSEEEDPHTKLRKRDSFVDFFHQKAKKRWRKVRLDMNVEKQKAQVAPWYNLSIDLSSQPQPREQTPNTAQLQTPESKQMETKQQTPVEQNVEEKSVESKNDRKEESHQEKLEEPSALPSCTLSPIPVLKKRRKTPYTKEELTCRVCSKTFINIYRLRRHEFSHGNERPYVCDQCGKAFKQSGHRNEHRLTHNVNKRSFLCNECGVVISSRSSFRYHLLSHKQLLAGNSISTANCEVSTRENQDSTSPGSGSQAHHSSHQKDPPEGSCGLQEGEAGIARSCLIAAAYDCPHCILRFATAQSLNCHLESHKEVEVRCHVQPFTCGECGRSFTYRHNLEKHRECHLKPEKRADSYQRLVQAAIAAGKPHFVCHTCGKVYLRKETLTKHMKTHLGLKPFQCMECQKSFTQKIHLTVHSRLHTGSRPFQCRCCRCCFLDSTALARHVMRDVCKSETFSFNVGKRGRKPFHMVMDEKVKAIVKSNRERRQRKGPASLRCGLCNWTGRYEGFLRRHMQRRHPHHGHKAVKDSTKPSSRRNDVITATTSRASATWKGKRETATTKPDSPSDRENAATTVTSSLHPPTHTCVAATPLAPKESRLAKQQPQSAS